ncbi:MAG TPA: hypothetical protein VIR34_21160, partial [Gemmatimonadaceae bacterium]
MGDFRTTVDPDHERVGPLRRDFHYHWRRRFRLGGGLTRPGSRARNRPYGWRWLLAQLRENITRRGALG